MANDETTAADDLMSMLVELLQRLEAEAEGSVNMEDMETARQLMHSFMELKLKKAANNSDQDMVVPVEFICPATKKLMVDPVTNSSSGTYDRASLKEQVNFIPNRLLRNMIENWCKEHSIHLPESSNYNEEEEEEDDDLLHMLEKISSTSDQKDYAKKLRQSIEVKPSIRAKFAESDDAVEKLVNVLSQIDPQHYGLKEDIIAMITSLCFHDDGIKSRVVATTSPSAIQLLISALSGPRMPYASVRVRAGAAAALSSICTNDLFKEQIGQLEPFEPLVRLVNEGVDFAVEEAVIAIHKLCSVESNKVKAITDGVVEMCVTSFLGAEMFKHKTIGNEPIDLLLLLSTNELAVDRMVVDAVLYLLPLLYNHQNPLIKKNIELILNRICLRYPDSHNLKENLATWQQEIEEKVKNDMQNSTGGQLQGHDEWVNETTEDVIERLSRASAARRHD